MNTKKSEVVICRVTREDKQNLEKLSVQLCTSKTDALRFMIQYFGEMETEEVIERKTRMEMQNLLKRMARHAETLACIRNAINKKSEVCA
jgi:pantoate kinase